MKPSGTRTLATIALLTFSFPAAAQFREKPLTEAEKLSAIGDDTRTEAAKLLASGDKSGAASKFRSAVESYEKALKADPRLVAAGAGLGAAAIALADYEKVVRMLTPFNASHPDNAEVTYHLGVALFKLKRYPQATPLLEKVSPIDTPEKPDYVLSHYYLGLIYLSAKQGEPAVREFTRFLVVRPAAISQIDAEMYLLLGQSHLLINRPKDARTAFEYALEGRPGWLSAQLGLVSALELEDKLPEAIEALEKLARANGKAPEPRERLGRLLLFTSKPDAAETVATELLKLGATPSAHLLLGDVRLAKKQFPAAEAELRQALKLAPELIPAQISLALALQGQGRGDEAIALLEGAIAAGSTSPDALAALGSVYRRAGRLQKAIATHQRLLNQLPGSAQPQLLLAADRFATGEWDLAITHYTAALKLQPNDAATRHWFALALTQRARARVDLNRMDDAMRDLRRAFDLEPSTSIGLGLGAVLLSLKSYPEARVALEQAARLPSPEWRVHLLAGYASLGANSAQEAVASFEEAAKMTDNSTALSDIYAGWALAKLAAGEFDVAVAKLGEGGKSKSADRVTRGNLPLALIRRALSSVETGNAAAAAKDLAAAEKLPGPFAPEVDRLLALTRGLVSIEEGKFRPARADLTKALSGNTGFSSPNVPTLMEAYLEYRQGGFTRARKLVSAARMSATKAEAGWAGDLLKAINRREGETLYANGSIPGAEKAFKAAFDAEPLNPYVLSNRACVQYRKGTRAPAVAAWISLQDTIPEAALNLGIDLQQKDRNYARAAAQYRKYLAAGGTRAVVRDWKERLESIYGIADDASKAPDVAAGEKR